MRIMYLVDRFWPYIGGVEVMAASVLPRLRERGHEFVVVTSRDDPKLAEHDEFRGIPVRRLPLNPALRDRDPERIAEMRDRLADLSDELSPDLFHVVFTGPMMYYLTVIPKADGAPVLLSFHGSWRWYRLSGGVLGRCVSKAAWVTACSESALRDLRSRAPAIVDRSSAICNGLDPPPTRPAPLQFDPPVLLCAGRIEHEKGFDVALEAFAEVLRSDARARLMIAGDGSLRAELEGLARRLGLADSVEFLGWVSPTRMVTLINRCTAVVVPSRGEGFGVIALEAALMSRPVVASNVGGLPEVLGDAGVLVPPEDSHTLAVAILRLLGDPDEAREVGRALKRRATRDFTADGHADQWEELYAHMIMRERSLAV